MLGQSPDYSVNYTVQGFFPVTNDQAVQLVNDWAASLGSNGWDQIREMPLGPIAGVTIDGADWNLSIEGDLSSGGQAYIYVYAAADNPLAATASVNNSGQAFQALQTNAANLAAANANPTSGGWLTPILWGVGIIAALAVINTVRK